MNKKKYSEIWTDLNLRLRHIERTDGGLGAALEALRNQQRDQGLELFFVPRHRLRSQSPEMSGTIGGFEVLGEVVFSSDEERRRLEFGKIDYHTVERILVAVRFD